MVILVHAQAALRALGDDCAFSETLGRGSRRPPTLHFCAAAIVQPGGLRDPPAGAHVLSALAEDSALWPVQSQTRAPLFAARTLNATGQYRVTQSLP